MKKLIIIATLLFSLQNFAQKRLEIYNFTGQTVQLADIITKPNTSATYPEYHSKPNGLITIAPGGEYILENTTTPVNTLRFPFLSTANYLPIWERANSASSTTIQASNVAWPLGNAQVFTRMLFYVGSSYNLLPTVPISTASYSISPAVLGSGWQADYDFYILGSVQIYTIVIY
jgi:hypothetical protein